MHDHHDRFKNTWEYWVLCDFEGNIIDASLAYNNGIDIPGLDTITDFSGLNIMEFLDEDCRDIFNRNFKEVIEKGKKNGIEHIKLKSGEAFSFEYDKELVYNDDKPVAIRITARDVTGVITARKSLELSEARYQSVFEHTGLPTVIVEDDLLLSKVNVRFETLVGYGKEDIEGKMAFSRFIADGETQQDIGRLLKHTGEQSQELECRMVSRNGAVFDMIMQVGNIAGTLQKVVSFTDITSRKKAEAHLRMSSAQLQKENTLLRSSMKDRYRFGDIIGKSPVMQETYEAIVSAAETHANAVIYGESGTGKELVAREIHRLSNRKNKQFVTVNCGAIPEQMIESEFFGYKKGAFTGAYTDKPGFLDYADGGTLFLDEVGEVNLNMQVKLLRVIDNGDYIPLGSNASRKTNVRIIAATNRNLLELIGKGLIREDFFYRIHIIPIHMPPLRDRKEDIPFLVDHFMDTYGEERKDVERIPIDRFLDYDWPGNVRELQNVVHRYVSLNKIDFTGSLQTTKDVPKTSMPVRDGEGLADLLNHYEKEIIADTLQSCQWHRGKAAKTLGINRKTLFTKMMKYGLNDAQDGVL